MSSAGAAWVGGSGRAAGGADGRPDDRGGGGSGAGGAHLGAVGRATRPGPAVEAAGRSGPVATATSVSDASEPESDADASSCATARASGRNATCRLTTGRQTSPWEAPRGDAGRSPTGPLKAGAVRPTVELAVVRERGRAAAVAAAAAAGAAAAEMPAPTAAA